MENTFSLNQDQYTHENNNIVTSRACTFLIITEKHVKEKEDVREHVAETKKTCAIQSISGSRMHFMCCVVRIGRLLKTRSKLNLCRKECLCNNYYRPVYCLQTYLK